MMNLMLKAVGASVPMQRERIWQFWAVEYINVPTFLHRRATSVLLQNLQEKDYHD